VFCYQSALQLSGTIYSSHQNSYFGSLTMAKCCDTSIDLSEGAMFGFLQLSNGGYCVYPQGFPNLCLSLDGSNCGNTVTGPGCGTVGWQWYDNPSQASSYEDLIIGTLGNIDPSGGNLYYIQSKVFSNNEREVYLRMDGTTANLQSYPASTPPYPGGYEVFLDLQNLSENINQMYHVCTSKNPPLDDCGHYSSDSGVCIGQGRQQSTSCGSDISITLGKCNNGFEPPCPGCTPYG